MFHLLDNQANIAGFKIFNNTILICDKNNIAYYNDVPITNDVDGTRIFCHSNFVFLPSYSGNKTYLFFNNQVKEIPFVLWLHTIEKSNVVGYDYIPARKAFKIFIYDYENSFVITRLFKELPIWDLIRKNDFIYFFEKRKITLFSFSLLTGEYEWEVDLGMRKYMDLGQEKEAQIRSIVGVWENILVVTMTHDEVITIDLKTGAILWETQDLLKKHLHKGNSSKWRGYLQNCYIENGKLYELTSSIYYSIDLQTQKVDILWQDVRENGFVTVVHSTYTENYIYFTGSYNNRFQPLLLGVFNRQTRQIDWLHDMTLSIDPNLGYVASLNQAPQISDDKLYVLDSGGTLHIFEKEQV